MFYDPSATSITWENSGISQDGIKINARPDSKSLKWYNNILEANGNTPLSKLNKIPQAAGIKCNIYVKLEYLNVGGSLEDRAAIRMLEAAAELGLKQDGTVIVPASGNIAIGIALACAVKGYKCVVVSPERPSRDTADLLNALGAQVIRTSNGRKHNSSESSYAYASFIAKGIENSYILDPNRAAANPLCHFESTGKEILDALNNNVDVIVVPVHTGAALCGISKYVKQKLSKCKVYGVDAEHSAFSGVAAHLDVPELGNEFIPSVAKNTDADGFTKVSAKDAFLMARKLIREEGIMVGPSSGAAIVAALKLVANLPEDSNVVVVMADGIRNYMNNFVDDQWLLDNKIIDKIERKSIAPKDSYDPSVLIYDPTTLAGEWKQDENKKWTKCIYNFKPYRPFRPAVLNNILEAIGNTPLVKLQRIPQEQGIDCNIFVKCEYFNAGGSTKDRIAFRMIELAEQDGRLKPGMTIIEPTSGNTGIGLALAAAVKGYACIIVMPVKMSKEKALAMEALGAVIIRTPNEAAFDSPDSHIGIALRLQKEIPGAIVLDQYRNIGNPLAHYEQTAEEIIDALNGNIDYVVIGAGTGGTVTGIAKKIKDKIPNCKVVGVDPEGSILADPNHKIAFYEVEGVGYDFIPGTLDRSVVDMWLKSKDKESFETSRSLIAKEGILCGGSSGSNVFAALEVARGLPKNKNVVAILPDGIRNYMTKFISNDWMRVRNFGVNEEM